jgi:hypothetical protein
MDSANNIINYYIITVTAAVSGARFVQIVCYN